MMTDIAVIALYLALGSSAYAAIAYFFGARKVRPDLTLSARNAVIAAFALTSVAMGVMLIALIGRDFSLEYVASYTDRNLGLIYTISAVWAGGAGSMLFWAWLLSLFAMIMVLQKRQMGKALIPYAAAITMVVQAFFLILLVSISNPFHKLPLPPADGNGLNPLLENPGMFLHPPTLLAGYVGFTIPFALAIAALITGKLTDEWLVMSRRWTLASWLILGVGNIAGSWWAYYVLGWGGYWAWDPVENAGLLPWFIGTAFLHSAMMQRRRGILKRWNMVLIILAFALSLFGTFLTRSGVIASVHSFDDSSLGYFFLVFIGIVLLGSLGLLYYRNHELKSETEIESVVSRESTFLLNNLLLVGGTVAVFIGTVFPILTEWVRGVKITVGPPFFNQVMTPIFLGIIFLTGVCTMIGWRRATVKNLVKNFLSPLIATVVLAGALIAFGVVWYAAAAIALCGFVVFTILYEWWRGTRARRKMRGENYVKAFIGLVMTNRPRYGGYIVHIGIVLIGIAIIGSSIYGESTEATLKNGEQMTLKNYTLQFNTLDRIETSNKVRFTSTMPLFQAGTQIGTMTPEKFWHGTHQNPITVAGVRSSLAGDVYVILVGWEADGAVSFKFVSNPLVYWLWIGGVVVLLGGLIAWWPNRESDRAVATARGELQ